MYGQENLFERNVSRLDGLEINHIRRLLKLYKEARRELHDRLLVGFSQNNSFTEERLERAMANVDIMIERMQSILNNELRFGFDNLYAQGVEDSTSEINTLEKRINGVDSPVSLEVILESTQPDNFLFNQYQSSVQKYNQDLRTEFQRVLSQALIQQKTWTQATFDMQQVFTGSEWMLQRVVRTELHNIYNVSKLKGFTQIRENYFDDLKKTLYHPMDLRTGDDSKVADRKQLIVALNKPFKYNFKGKARVFMTPPDRPNDRAILIPYRKSYDKGD